MSDCPQNHFLSQNKNQHSILNTCVKSELNSLGNKKVTENLIFDGTSGLKLETTSYSGSAYDVTIFCCFENFLAYTLFLLSFIAVRPQMAKLNWGLHPAHYRGISDPVQNRVNVVTETIT